MAFVYWMSQKVGISLGVKNVFILFYLFFIVFLKYEKFDQQRSWNMVTTIWKQLQNQQTEIIKNNLNN